MKPKRLSVLLIVGTVAFIGCVTHNIVQAPTGRVQLISGAYNQFTPQQDIQLGQQAAAQVERTMPLLPNDSPVTQYIQRLGQKLAAHAPGPNRWPFNFHVVNQKEINAFALPGGPIFVNLGTIQAADDEGELAGVMAHETSHVVLRHSTEQASKAMIAQLPLQVLGAITGGGLLGELERMGIGFGANSIFLKYSRTAESEADLLGSQIMYDTGYNPYDMVEFFSKLEKGGGSRAPQFLSDHPNPGNREQAISQAIRKYPRKNYLHDSAEFERIKSIVATMHPLTAQQIQQWQEEHTPRRSAVTPGDIVPAGQFQVLNHNAFQIVYPANWQVLGNANSAVLIAPQAGVSQSAIAYGVIVNGFRPQQAGESLVQATGELIGFLHQSDPKIQVAGNPQPVNLNGLQGVSVTLSNISPMRSEAGEAMREIDELVTVPRGDGSLLYLLFIAPERDMQQLMPVYRQMLGSLQLR